MTNNIYLVDKPSGWTSFDVVAKVRGTIKKSTGEKVRVGHAGTLDPFATGLLIILTGNETKKQSTYMKLDKEYEATLFLGATSTTGDPEGTITKRLDSHEIDSKKVTQVLQKFVGKIEQTPPQYSAIKINGQPAYKSARLGKIVDIKSRDIDIYSIDNISLEWPILKFAVNCSSGTYIRVLAEDIGKILGCGAYLTELRRIKIGKHSINDAKKVESLINGLGKG
jgi:tRNA pseudouridine55 synthase